MPEIPAFREISKMPAVDILDSKNNKAGKLELADEVFGVKPNKGLVHEALVNQLANARQGTAGTKTRHFVSGGGIKPWRQKGTGRARSGSSRSPIWRHGGVVFGPHPRDYSYALPKRASRQALTSVLSARLASGNLIVVDKIAFSGPKTKEAAAFIAGLNLTGTTLLISTGEDRNTYLAARNLAGVTVIRVENINVFDLLKHANIVADRGAVEKLQEVLK